MQSQDAGCLLWLISLACVLPPLAWCDVVYIYIYTCIYIYISDNKDQTAPIYRWLSSRLQYLHSSCTGSILPYQPSAHLGMGKIMLWICKNFYHHIEIVCVTCQNILKIGIRLGATKSLGRTLSGYTCTKPSIYIGVVWCSLLSYIYMHLYYHIKSHLYWAFAIVRSHHPSHQIW